ncbi:MAG TPA: glycosyltransferase family protein, partial [Bacteroidia bacterium]
MRILIAPLDWGLGHATRCIPIISYLTEKKCEVIIAADGRALQLLRNEPACRAASFVELPGYNISYPKNGSMAVKMAAQIPKILSGIKKEHKQLKKIIREKKIDAVISDNRFGLWSKDVPCVFITHQLMVKSPFGENLIHKLNKNYISKYSDCWIPDVAGENNLSGDLSHKFPLSSNAKFIGALSRMSRDASSPEMGDHDLLAILSGPEPQRTLFEKKILEQARGCDFKILVV